MRGGSGRRGEEEGENEGVVRREEWEIVGGLREGVWRREREEE